MSQRYIALQHFAQTAKAREDRQEHEPFFCLSQLVQAAPLLRRIDLSHNALKSIPRELLDLDCLEYIYLANNQIIDESGSSKDIQVITLCASICDMMKCLRIGGISMCFYGDERVQSSGVKGCQQVRCRQRKTLCVSLVHAEKYACPVF